MSIRLSNTITIQDREYTISTMRSQGPGGQNVNRVSSAIHLRFDIRASGLPLHYKNRLLATSDQKITKEGVLVIKAQTHRSQEQNKIDAVEKLRQFILLAIRIEKPRRPTKATLSSQKKRMDKKSRHGQTKSLRGRIKPDD